MKQLTHNDIEWLNDFLHIPNLYKSYFTCNMEDNDNHAKALLNDTNIFCLQPNEETLCILHRYSPENNNTMVLDIGVSKKGWMHTVNALEKCFDWIFEQAKSETVVTYITLGKKDEERIVVDSGMIPIDMQSISPGNTKKIFVYNRELWELRNRGHSEQEEIFQIATANLEHNFRWLFKRSKIFTTA